MTNAPALIVRHQRFTLVIAVLLAGMLVVCAVGISMELHQAGAHIALILLPQILILLGAYLVKSAYDRWAASTVCLTVSAEGLTLPGIAIRPIPWTAVRSVQGVRCSPAPRQAAAPRHYLLVAVEAPESFGVAPRPGVQRALAPLPADAPLVTLDLSELDTSTEAILAAVRRFRPDAVADTDPARQDEPAAFGNDASIRLPSRQELGVGAARARAELVALVARRREIWPALLDARRCWEPRVRSQALLLAAAAAELYRTGLAIMHARASSLRSQAAAQAAHAAHTLETMRSAVLDLRQRFARGLNGR